MEVLAASRLPGVTVGFEGGQDRVEVAGGQRVLILTDDTRLAQLRVGFQQRWAARVTAG